MTELSKSPPSGSPTVGEGGDGKKKEAYGKNDDQGDLEKGKSGQEKPVAYLQTAENEVRRKTVGADAAGKLAENKAAGSEEFKKGNFEKAIQLYSTAISTFTNTIEDAHALDFCPDGTRLVLGEYTMLRYRTCEYCKSTKVCISSSAYSYYQ